MILRRLPRRTILIEHAKRFASPGAARARTVVHGGLVYTVATAREETDSMAEQTRDALGVLDLHLAEAGTNKSHLLRVTVYITDMARKSEMNAAWEQWVDFANPPQRACIGAQLESGDLIELVAIAALP